MISIVQGLVVERNRGGEKPPGIFAFFHSAGAPSLPPVQSPCHVAPSVYRVVGIALGGGAVCLVVPGAAPTCRDGIAQAVSGRVWRWYGPPTPSPV